MLIIALRTAIMYVLVVLCLRVMGKRQIAELEPSELVVTIIISEIAADPIVDQNKPFATAMVSIIILLFLEVFLSYVAYKKISFRSFLYGKPSTFYSDGKVNQKEMENQRYSVGDLLEEIRNSGASSLGDVEYVIMETNGDVSVIQNSANRPVTPSDLGIDVPSPQISYIIIDNGNLIKNNLIRLNLDKGWVMSKLKEEGISRISQVFYMGADKSGKCVVIKKE